MTTSWTRRNCGVSNSHIYSRCTDFVLFSFISILFILNLSFIYWYLDRFSWPLWITFTNLLLDWPLRWGNINGLRSFLISPIFKGIIRVSSFFSWALPDLCESSSQQFIIIIFEILILNFHLMILPKISLKLQLLFECFILFQQSFNLSV